MEDSLQEYWEKPCSVNAFKQVNLASRTNPSTLETTFRALERCLFDPGLLGNILRAVFAISVGGIAGGLLSLEDSRVSNAIMGDTTIYGIFYSFTN